MSLAPLWAYAPPDKSALKQLRLERGWWLWLAPRPFTLVSSALYLTLLINLVLNGCNGCYWQPWSVPVAAGVLLALLALDRLDYWFFGETPPARAALLLLAARFLLIEVLAQLGGMWAAMWPYALVPYVAALYFGIRGGYLSGALVWIIVVGRITLQSLESLQVYLKVYFNYDWREFWGQYVSSIAPFTILLIFVVTAARIVLEERASRKVAEGLLADLESSNRQLQAYSERAISATQERNRLARDIHDSLGHYLTVVSVQLEKALTFRPIEARAADQAVEDAKRLASEALQDVRHSVGALRAGGEESSLPTEQRVSHAQTPANGHLQLKVPVRGWRLWLAPRPFDLVSASLYLGILVTDFAWMDPGEQPWSWRLYAVVVLALIALDRVDYRLFGETPPTRAAVVLLALRLVLIGAVGVLGGAWYVLWLVPIIPYIGFLYFGNRGGYWTGVGVWVGIAALATAVALNEAPPGQFDFASLASTLLFVSLMMLLVITTSRTIVQERASRARAEGLLGELEATNRQLRTYFGKALAAVQERNHLARDIHDGLGHYLTVINVQLEKALAFRARDPLAADQAITDARRLTADALREVRQTMGELRASPATFSLRAALAELVKNVSNGHIVVDLHIEGKEEGFSKQSLMALYRAAQEGLTNVQKHAKASRVVLDVRFTDNEARLEVRDDGQGFEPLLLQAAQPNRDKSYGLQGVRERLELVGGTMDVKSKPGRGTRLLIVVPGDSQAHSELALSLAQEVQRS